MAAGTPFTGKSMTFKTGGTPTEVDHTGKWELTIGGASAKYATNSTGGWRKTTVGVGEWSGTVTVMLHAGGAQPLARGDEVAAQFHADSDDYISGTIIITEVGPITFDADSGDPVAIDYDRSKAIAQQAVSSWQNQGFIGSAVEIATAKPSGQMTTTQDDATGVWTTAVQFDLMHVGV